MKNKYIYVKHKLVVLYFFVVRADRMRCFSKALISKKYNLPGKKTVKIVSNLTILTFYILKARPSSVKKLYYECRSFRFLCFNTSN